MRTIALAGLGATLFMILLFSLLWILDIRKRSTGRLTAGHWANAFGFGLLPGIAAWKAFDAFAGSTGNGKPLFPAEQSSALRFFCWPEWSSG